MGGLTLFTEKKVCVLVICYGSGSSFTRHQTKSPPSEYGLPMDEEELERIDLCHVKYHTLLHDKRFLAPISPHPQRVLDLGCGTGEYKSSSSCWVRMGNPHRNSN